MNVIYNEYLVILIFFSVAFLISFVILIFSYILNPQQGDQEKVSAYECGFNPFDDARATFDVRFYLVAILFLIFDLEISFLFPWSLVLGQLSLFGFWSMILFLAILTLGFVYEWKKGALEWE
uniref:NADH-ubiquinone oxidoreductase chain 3 n=1 Tax=Pyropia perforata TaxID=182771 RepID=A0A060D7S9_PYRPE|nr:NADH dehydrogenase subunit 3 [Neoporphyra perforata]AIB08168.1 NADH dehydrogenase subunit 3 [Neoporphyra perforata]